MADASSRLRPKVIIDGEQYEADLRLASFTQPYRLRARQVLNDGLKALELLEATDDIVIGRIQYFALVAILRAVGHVLHKVDGGADEGLQRVSTRKFNEMKADPESYEIFFDFIEAERNLILKEYRSNAEMQTSVPLLIDREGNEKIIEFVPFPMFIFDDGPFAGEDARDVACDAIAFWDSYLGEVELEYFGISYEQGLYDEAVALSGLKRSEHGII